MPYTLTYQNLAPRRKEEMVSGASTIQARRSGGDREGEARRRIRISSVSDDDVVQRAEQGRRSRRG
ncbi:hypothetical protein CRG98_029350 [Punica granatum]|uniref:Uncharacterized protein n=1 Tax=Punica granatum TaxID=22663 RepID=A0A2I0J216_PUNGR|nr:hypothetical protein CRG98_029350 [Punica granatum]